MGFRLLKGEDLTPFDTPKDPVTFAYDSPPAGHDNVIQRLRNWRRPDPKWSRAKQLGFARAVFDSFSDDRVYDVEIKTVEGDINGEWVLAENADPTRRLLYIHGGAFTLGSPQSHRPITARLAKITGASVFSLDYRLMPENRRMASVEDSRAAYDWLVKNSPDGESMAEKTALAGDSAGGNLVLALAAWIRDTDRKAPSAIIGFAPITDHTISAPSIRQNFETDLMLQRVFAPVLKLPNAMFPILGLLVNKMPPANPEISPVYGDLSNLPPTLIQASDAEMLVGDNQRYVNKARAAGSDITFQTWSHMVHVFQIFDDILPEADNAYAEIEKFLKDKF